MNGEFDQLFKNLRRDVLPSLNEVFAIVGGEEGQRNVMLENSNSNSMDGSTLSISKSNVNDGTMAATIAAPKATNSGKMERVKPIEKDSLCCSYYHKNHHTRENLWKLHDKPLNFFGKNNGGREGNSSYRS